MFFVAVLAACSGPPAGRSYSAASPLRFGSAAYPSAPSSESSEPAETASGEGAPAAAPSDDTKAIGIVQPSEAPSTPARQSQTAAAAPEALVAGRHPKPEELVGLKPEEIKQILGSPALIRHDSPAQIWQYRGHDCVLDLFLYPPPAAGEAARGAKTAATDAARTVVYYELRGRTAKQAADDRCFSALVAAARARRSG